MLHLLIWARENLTVGGPTLVPRTEEVMVARSLRLGSPKASVPGLQPRPQKARRLVTGRRSSAANSPSPRSFSGRKDHVVSWSRCSQWRWNLVRGDQSQARGFLLHLFPVWGTGSSDAKCATASGFPRITHRPEKVSPPQPQGHLPQLAGLFVWGKRSPPPDGAVAECGPTLGTVSTAPHAPGYPTAFHPEQGRGGRHEGVWNFPSNSVQANKNRNNVTGLALLSHP